MDIKLLPDSRYSTMTGTTGEFELLDEGVAVLETLHDDDNGLLGQNSNWSEAIFGILQTNCQLLPHVTYDRKRA